MENKPVLKMRGRYQGPDNCYASFMCPGCGYEHTLGIADGCTGPRWTWNGDMVRPTFTPSVLGRGGGRDGQRVCHSFVTDGNIQFLDDCTHALAGQTVPLQPWPEEH
jgi:hypothetical protein